MSKYVFMETWRTSRGGLGAGIEVMDVEKFKEKVLIGKKGYWNQYRYCKVNGVSSLLNSMTLEEFEEIFPDNPFSAEQITNVFSKAVSEKYGLHKIRKETKRIPAKDLEIGRLYKAGNGDELVYFGKVKAKLETLEHSKKSYFGTRKIDGSVNEYDGYLYGYKRKGESITDCFTWTMNSGRVALGRPYVLKSRKKLVEKLDFKVEVPNSLRIESDFHEILEIEFLEVPADKKLNI